MALSGSCELPDENPDPPRTTLTGKGILTGAVIRSFPMEAFPLISVSGST